MAGLLDKEFLAQLEYLYIVAKEGYLTRANAQRVSKRFGAGLEYADHRDYVPGDDFRYVDWQAFARLDRLVIKLFSEEEELSIYLLIDASSSMARGRPEKLLFAKQALAALGYVGLGKLDRVMVVPFDSDLRPASTSFVGRGRRLEMLRFVENIEPRGQTDIKRAIKSFVGHYKRRGLVILASDFFDPGYPLALRLLHHNGYDCLLMQVNDRSEVEPPLKGDFELVDCESGETVQARVTPAVRALYAEEWERHYGDLRRLARGFDQGLFSTVSDESVEDLVIGIFRRSGFLR